MIKDKDNGVWMLFCYDEPYLPILFNAISKVSYKAEGDSVDSPIEGGSFITYNKKTKPLSLTIDLEFQGSQYWQAAILLELRIIQNTASRLAFVTPNGVYTDMTLITLTFDRTSKQGTELLTVQLTLKEVMDVDSCLSVRNTIRHINEKMGKKIDTVSILDAGTVQTETVKANQIAA